MPPHRLLPCCAKMASSRLMKFSDFEYNHIGHYLKWIESTVTDGVAMATLLLKSAWPKFSDFLKEMAFFSFQ